MNCSSNAEGWMEKVPFIVLSIYSINNKISVLSPSAAASSADSK